MDEASQELYAALDHIDRQLLDHLQHDGRLAIAELARRVHLSPTPCLERVRRLEREGLIRGYVARLDATRLGLPVLAFVAVKLDKTTPTLFGPFQEMIRALSEVVECHMIAGGFDYLLKVRTKSMETFRCFLNEKLATLPGIAQTHTYFSLEEVKANELLSVVEAPGTTPRATAPIRKTYAR